MVGIASAVGPIGFGPGRGVRTARARSPEELCRTDDWVSEALARVIDGAILPRLRLLHQPPSPSRQTIRHPTAEDTERLHALLLAPGPVDLGAEVAVLLGGGMAFDIMLLDLLVPAARHLGTLWEEDAVDFVTVTEGLGRLQVLTRRLCAGLEPDTPRAERSILLMPCPGETHLYALSIVASFFRMAGWGATILDGAEASATDLVRDAWFDVVGLSLACDVHLDALRETVAVLRRASCNPALVVVVGGPWFARNGDDAQVVGADACVADGRAAPCVVEMLLDPTGAEALANR